jgi:hypothetical protein
MLAAALDQYSLDIQARQLKSSTNSSLGSVLDAYDFRPVYIIRKQDSESRRAYPLAGRVITYAPAATAK